MIKWPEELTERLKETLGPNLKSVVLYGSAAADDRTRVFSDYNVLVVVGEMGLETLKHLAPIARKWGAAGNPTPLLFTEQRLRGAGDVFPIEFLDIKTTHRILFGADPFAGLDIQTGHLRHQLEYELRGKLIQLRQRYMDTEGKPRAVIELAEKSISTFAVLFKATLRLLGEEPPTRRAEVFGALKAHIDIDEAALREILALREKKRPSRNPDELFSALLASVEAAVDFVNDFERRNV